MFAPFFTLAAVSPSRQRTFRKAVAAHLVLMALAVLALVQLGPTAGLLALGNWLLVAGILQGATLVGWRLTQLPRSQALEFLLVSPLQPGRAFLAEALVGLSLLALVTISGLPVLLVLYVAGLVGPVDLLALTAIPWIWGAATGLGLAAWAYQPRRSRRIGEAMVGLLIVAYLVVGVLAGEKLRLWLEGLPETARVFCWRAFLMLHTHNPFGALRHWLENDLATAWRRALFVQGAGLGVIALLLWRGAARMKGHFHERHYEPIRDRTGARPPVGPDPLSWWAVKRVSEYSGRINLWLAGGFCLLYAIYVVAAERWPDWMGRRIFEMCDAAGGPAVLAAALVLLAAVPAAFQYGLWDSSVPDRCRRLELLLLTELRPIDYWRAACLAALARGRGYLLIALGLWGAGWLGGRMSVGTVFGAAATAVLLWGLYFALGFRAFARGAQANGLGLLLTVALPLAAVALAQSDWPTAVVLLPPGMVYHAGRAPLSWQGLLGPVLIAAATLALARHSLATCEARLRQWYDDNAGRKVMT